MSSGVSDKVRHKPACAATEASYSNEISAIESWDITLSRQRTTKALIRLCWSAPLLFANDIRHVFSWPGSHVKLLLLYVGQRNISELDHLVLYFMVQWLRTLVSVDFSLTPFSGSVNGSRVQMSCFVTKPTKWHVRPTKTQISLGIRPVWSESSLSAWRKPESLTTH